MCKSIGIYVSNVQLFYIEPVISSAVTSMGRQSPLVCAHWRLLLSMVWALCPDPDEESVV